MSKHRNYFKKFNNTKNWVRLNIKHILFSIPKPVWLIVLLYCVVANMYVLDRHHNLLTSYYDLGIMHQAVYNSYQGIKTGEFSRIFEITNPVFERSDQIPRFGIHSDYILLLAVPFYFIHPHPETLLILQTIIISMGSIFIYKIATLLLNKFKYQKWVSFIFSVSFLLYVPLHYVNRFEVHAVTLNCMFIPAFYYFYLKRKFTLSLLFAFLALTTKETTGITIAALAFSLFFVEFIKKLRSNKFDPKRLTFTLLIAVISILWSLIHIFIIIPHFLGTEHFGIEYYKDVSNSQYILQQIFNSQTGLYLRQLFGPVLFLSLLSPIMFSLLPELFINVFSAHSQMKLITFHYQSILIPLIFLTAIVSLKNIEKFLNKNRYREKIILGVAVLILIISTINTLISSPFIHPTPLDTYLTNGRLLNHNELKEIQRAFDDDYIKLSTSITLGSYFTSRRYFYTLNHYEKADYVIIDTFGPALSIDFSDAYFELLQDNNFELIYKSPTIQIFQKI